MSIINISECFVYDEAHYQRVAIEMIYQDGVQQLMKELPFPELLNHISTVFYCDRASNTSKKLGGCEIEIHVGKESPDLQSIMQEKGIQGIIGLTPKFPIQNPSPSDMQNSWHVRLFQEHLTSWGIDYIPAFGRARDFREGGDGCFLLIDVSPEQVMRLLESDGEPTQLSVTYLPASGKAQLLSCIEPEPEENRLRTILLKMSQKERALTLSFLGAVLAEQPEYPSACSPRVLEFMLYAQKVKRDRQIKLASLLTRLLENPNLLGSR